MKWEDKKEEILRDIQPIQSLAKEILHSNRYMDGEHLTDVDEKVVVERLLRYHPESEDMIGCGIDSIMHDTLYFWACVWCHGLVENSRAVVRIFIYAWMIMEHKDPEKGF
ncbi:hypothetical protein V6N13_065632 [Hibiscus sabdariffa]